MDFIVYCDCDDTVNATMYSVALSLNIPEVRNQKSEEYHGTLANLENRNVSQYDMVTVTMYDVLCQYDVR